MPGRETMEHTKPATTISDDVQTMLCWLPFNAGTSYKLLDDFTLVFEEEHRLPVLLSGDDLEHYKNTSNISITAHSVLLGCLSGYGQRIPLVEKPEREYAFMADTIRKLAKEGFSNDDLGVFLCSVAQWLREYVNLQTARKALSTAMLLEPLHAGLRNDFIGTTWQLAETAEPVVQQNLLNELIDTYQHQFLGEVSQENLEMCSYFFCCALGLLERWQLPEEGEWYASARHTITNEQLLQNLDDGEQYGFSMNQCSLMLSQEKAPEDAQITYGAYWYAVAGEEMDTVIQQLLDNENAIPWRFFRKKTESDEIDGISESSTVLYADYPSESPLRYLCLSKCNDTQKLLNVISMYPYCAEGVANTLEIQSLEKLDEYEGYVRATAPESGASITFFDPLFMMDQMSLCEGYPISINLAAIAMSLHKADLNEFDITSGPLLDLERERVLEENPDVDPAEISKVKISMKGTAICIHTRERFFEAEIRSTAHEVDWFELEGIEYCRILATLIREPDNRPIDYFIYATATALDGYRPQPGDDVQGVVWLQGHLDRSARRLLEDGDGLSSVEDALQAVVANPGLIYGLFDIMAESPANPPQLRARCAYTLARLAQKNGLMLSGWNHYLANYRFHDEPVAVDRQFALMLPNLVLSTHDFVRALYTLYSLISSDDEPTKILALSEPT